MECLWELAALPQMLMKLYKENQLYLAKLEDMERDGFVESEKEEMVEPPSSWKQKVQQGKFYLNIQKIIPSESSDK